MPFKCTDPMIRILGKVRVDPATNCWLYTGWLNPCGYPEMRIGGTKAPRKRMAHIIVYERIRGPVPPDHQLHHECRQRSCVNPWHMAPLTPTDHMRLHHDEKPKPECCIHGHQWTAKNTMYATRRSGPQKGKIARFCRECRRLGRLKARRAGTTGEGFPVATCQDGSVWYADMDGAGGYNSGLPIVEPGTWVPMSHESPVFP
jgi:hypothetical protein